MLDDTQSAADSCPDPRVMLGVIPYLCLPGQCGAAADFYIMAFAARDGGRMPMECKQGHYMHLQLEINGGSLMLTDYEGMPSASGGKGSAVRGHLQLIVEDGQAWWDRAVGAGCTVIEAYQRQFWGDDWGLLEDPFGLRWAIMTPNPSAGAGSA